jgi:hypothetical protein
MRTQYALAAVVLACAADAALAQEQVVASLPWLHGQTSGPNGTDYQPPDDGRDLWVVEDFTLAADQRLTRFESWGTVFPAPVQVFDINVRVYDGLPTVGNLVLSSVPGTGSVTASGLDYRFGANFGGQYLRAGSYWLVWNASTATGSGGHIAIWWAQAGAHAVGGGLPDNGMQWNPGGTWGYPGNIRQVPAQLGGGGQIGVNFSLMGTPGCYGNCDGSTAAPVLNVADFTCFLQEFAAGHGYANCDGSTAEPVLNVADFTCFLQRFAAGCS